MRRLLWPLAAAVATLAACGARPPDPGPPPPLTSSCQVLSFSDAGPHLPPPASAPASLAVPPASMPTDSR